MPETIAIAEDEQDLREAVAEFLELAGYRVIAAADAAEFRKLTQFESVDLSILDINMAGEDGLSLARWIRSRDAGSIVFATAAVSPIERVIGLEIGADDYLTKPYDLRELLARVRSILRRNKARARQANGRRLAVIASVDIVGYTRLIREDEAGTLAITDQMFKDVLLPILQDGSGQVFKMLGDGALIEFSSVHDAIEWATAFQAAVLDTQSSVKEPRIRCRIGIAAGDIIVRNDDRFGETVAMSVRIQEQAPPGGILLGEAVHAMLRDKTKKDFECLGMRTLKNVPEPAILFSALPEERRVAADDEGS